MKHRQRKKKMVRPLTNEAYKTIQIAICIFLVVATFAVYWQVLDHEFLNYDDKEYVINNWNVSGGAARAPKCTFPLAFSLILHDFH